MDFSEIVGFVIVLFVFLVPLLRKLLIDKKKVQQNDEVVQEEVYIEEEVPPPPPRVEIRPHTTERLVKRDYEFDTEFQERDYQSDISERKLETHVDPKFRERIVSDEFLLETQRKRRNENPLVAIVKKRSAAQAMVILSEVLNRYEH